MTSRPIGLDLAGDDSLPDWPDLPDWPEWAPDDAEDLELDEESARRELQMWVSATVTHCVADVVASFLMVACRFHEAPFDVEHESRTQGPAGD